MSAFEKLLCYKPAMPELPEVETIARSLTPQIKGRRIAAFLVLRPRSLQAGLELLPALAGARILGARRRAKLLLLDVLSQDGPLLLVFHLKMTGGFLVHPPGSEALKHTRLIVDMGADGRLFFDDARSFGWCRVMRPDELFAWPFWTSLGPEPLECAQKDLAAHLLRRFAGKKRNIKACLLDQQILGGIGNIYADEALFKASIAPTRQAGSLSSPESKVLAGALQAILRQAIDECGSSIRDYRDANGNAGSFQNSFAVYGRKGRTCRVCGAELASGRVAGRGTVWCPSCQR